MKLPPPGITPVELLADIIDHVPGIIKYYPFVPFPPELALPSWACHLGEVWAKPRQLVAPNNYDVAYKNQSPRARVEFLAALRRLQRMVCQALINDYTGGSLFDMVRWKEDAPAPAYSNLELHTLTTRGAAWLLSWLNWRELSPAEQLLTALGTVQISNANLVLKERAQERPSLLFIPDCAPQDEAERFGQLLKDFKRHIPSKKPALRGLLARLEPLRALTLDTLPERSVWELPTYFPAVEWKGLHNRPAENSEAETFWPDLAQALRTRAEWAARSYDTIEFVLSKAKAHTPAATANPGSVAPAPEHKKGQYNLYDKLCGGYQATRLLKVVGSDGLRLYDTTINQESDTATPTNWAILYWGLQYKRFLPDGISNETASKLLGNTFGAKISKTRIGDTKPDLNQVPKRGTYLARVVDLLSEITA